MLMLMQRCRKRSSNASTRVAMGQEVCDWTALMVMFRAHMVKQQKHCARGLRPRPIMPLRATIEPSVS
jgi:hypothetical protein